MLCILAGNLLEAKRFALAQDLNDDEWFFPYDESDLSLRNNFHVLVIGTAGMNTPSSYFDKILELARTRGRMNRR